LKSAFDPEALRLHLRKLVYARLFIGVTQSVFDRGRRIHLTTHHRMPTVCGRTVLVPEPHVGLQTLAAGLAKPRGEKRLAKLHERIGRLKEKSRVGQHYEITLSADATGEKALALTFKRLPVTGTMLTHSGVYCLRTNETARSEQRLWSTYTMLTDLEAVFRSLKSELGLRPIYHHKESRTDGHLFISVIAYQVVQIVRRQLKARDIHLSWNELRSCGATTNTTADRRTTGVFGSSIASSVASGTSG
jgi:hypothetical protein